MAEPTAGAGSPAVLCYDGSDHARAAIERAAAVLGGGSAVVLTVWESVATTALYRHEGATSFGRGIREISREVVDELDASTAESAEATAEEGAEVAVAAGFDARPVARRAIGRAAERPEVTVWQAVLEAADEEDARVIVLGSRGRSGLGSMLLGSVSYGVVHHSSRPLLLVPGRDE